MHALSQRAGLWTWLSQVHQVGVQAQQAPEVLRVPLQQLCLTVKAAAAPGTRLEATLARLLTPPQPSAVAAAVAALGDLGALGSEEALTPLGRHLARLPCDARLGKALLYGAMLRCASLSSVNARLDASHCGPRLCV